MTQGRHSTGRTVAARGRESFGSSYVLVIEPDSSRRVPLPAAGTVLIGRDPEAQVRIEHRSVSRRHATLWLEGGLIRVADEGSHNGTRVNGELVEGQRLLAGGDTIAIGDVVLVLYAGQVAPSPAGVVDEARWRARLVEELERAESYERALSVAVLCGGGNLTAQARAIASELRRLDAVALDGQGSLLLLLPELDGEAARELVETAIGLETGAGLAAYPVDAVDADTLLGIARRAARAAAPGQIAGLAATAETLDLDGRRVLIADPGMARQFELIRRLAATALPILVVGETGVGKENAAYALHFYGKRRGEPFLAVNCAAIPEPLVESTLFGHERGAFTGAAAAKVGLLEAAGEGTVLLDEIGELPLALQAKLLRALDAGRFTRVGGTHEQIFSARVVAATNRVLEDEVKAGRFRQDLFFRLGATVHLPPLRERRVEIPLLVRAFAAEARAQAGLPPLHFTPAAMRILNGYSWPGNVRDLRMVAEVLAATIEDDQVEASDLPERLGPPAAEPAPPVGRAAPPVEAAPGAAGFRPLAEEIEELERTRMREALAAAGGVKTRAAALLGMPIRTFSHKMKHLGVKGEG
jgi:two-component system response regulator AtoC